MADIKKKLIIKTSAEGTKETENKVSGLEKSFASLTKGVVAGTAVFLTLKKTLVDSTKAAIEQEAIYRNNTSLY